MDSRALSDSFRLTATPEAPRLARHRVSLACDGLDDELRFVAELLTSELVTNALRHPPREDSEPGVEIEVNVHRTDRSLRIEVFDHDSRPLPEVEPPDAPSEGGMGLYLVEELAAAWGAHPVALGAGKVVWFEIGAPGGG